jgi:hypothetical protein
MIKIGIVGIGFMGMIISRPKAIPYTFFGAKFE